MTRPAPRQGREEDSQIFDLSRATVRELNQALHNLTGTADHTHWIILNPSGQHAIAAGIDAYRGGWVAIVLEDGRFVDAPVAVTLADLVAGLGPVEAIGVDIPIGLPVHGPRAADVEARENMYYDIYFPGHWIGMPPPLSEDLVEYADGTPATIEQMASDVAVFLTWAGEPTLEVRKQTGLKVMLFLIVLTALLYAAKRKVWADAH